MNNKTFGIRSSETKSSPIDMNMNILDIKLVRKNIREIVYKAAYWIRLKISSNKLLPLVALLLPRLTVVTVILLLNQPS
jgi:hypothetical protein